MMGISLEQMKTILRASQRREGTDTGTIHTQIHQQHQRQDKANIKT